METQLTQTEWGKLFRLQIPSHPKFIPPVRNLISSLAILQGFTPSGAADWKLVVGEALANTIKHSYRGKENRPIFLEIKLLSDTIELRIRDFGRKANPSKLRGNQMKDYRTSGIGLYLIKRLTDYYYIEESEAPGNLTVFIKKKV